MAYLSKDGRHVHTHMCLVLAHNVAYKAYMGGNRSTKEMLRSAYINILNFAPKKVNLMLQFLMFDFNLPEAGKLKHYLGNLSVFASFCLTILPSQRERESWE